MNKQEQIQFVKELTTHVTNSIIRNIANDSIPGEWDGIELRQYIADKFYNEARYKMDRKRKSDYNNTVLINDL